MPRTLRRKILTLFYALLAGTFSAESAEICFKSAAQCSGTIVRLGDVADIQGADADQAGALKRIELFPTPATRRTRVVRAADLQQLLLLQGVDPEQHRFSGATSIRIVAQTQAAPTQRIAEDTTAEPIRKAMQIIFAKRAIGVGETIADTDIEIRSVDDSAITNGMTESSQAVIGQEVTRALAADQPVDVRFLRKPQLVQRGQAVSVVANSDGVRARTTAKALENGTRGDLILVESLDTKQKFSVVVTGSQQAEVVERSIKITDSQLAHSARRPRTENSKQNLPTHPQEAPALPVNATSVGGKEKLPTSKSVNWQTRPGFPELQAPTNRGTVRRNVPRNTAVHSKISDDREEQVR